MYLFTLIIFLIGGIIFFQGENVYGHGLGIDTIPSIDIQGKKFSISVEISPDPEMIENNKITITAIEDTTKEKAKNVTFLIGLFHENNLVFRNYFFTADGVLSILMKSISQDEIIIHGNQDSLLGAWHSKGSDPIEIEGPIFGAGGLYNFEIEVKTIDEPNNIIKDSRIYSADISIPETIEFLEIDSQNRQVEFKIKSYFDKISNFEYNPTEKQVIIEMPFDWSEKKISHIPFVHVELHIPKEFEEFFSPSYTGQVNGVDLFKSSVTIDDYTEENERIVHFVLLQDHLNVLKNQLVKSDIPLPENVTFVLYKSDIVEFPLSAFTKSEDYQVNLSWDPIEISPGKKSTFIFTIRDGKTGEPLRNSDYTFVIMQNGEEIHTTKGLAQIGGEFEEFTFKEGQTGPTILRFDNIRNSGQSTEFGIVVVPEFGAIVLYVLFITLVIVTVLNRNNLVGHLFIK